LKPLDIPFGKRTGEIRGIRVGLTSTRQRNLAALAEFLDLSVENQVGFVD